MKAIALSLLVLLAACATPELNCLSFPEFGPESASVDRPEPGDQRAVLQEAAALRDADAFAIVQAYLALGDAGGAREVLVDGRYMRNRSEAGRLLIEEAIQSGDVALTRSLVDEFVAERFGRLGALQISRAYARSGDLASALSKLAEAPPRADDRPAVSNIHRAVLARDLAEAGHIAAAQQLANEIESETLLLRAQSFLAIAESELAAGNEIAAKQSLDRAVRDMSWVTSAISLNRDPLKQAVAAAYLQLGEEVQAGRLLDQVVRSYSGPGGTFQASQLLAIYRMQLLLEDRSPSDYTANLLVRRYSRGDGDWTANRFDLSALVGLVSAQFEAERPISAYQALQLAKSDYARSAIAIAIAVAEARTDRVDEAIERATAMEDDDASCSAVAGVSLGLASIGQTARAVTLAEGIDLSCLRRNRFVPSTEWSEIGNSASEPIASIAVMASHYGDAESVCRALSQIDNREVWERTIEEVVTARSDQGDWDGARALIQYVQETRPVGPAALSRTYARMVSKAPPAWSPERFGVVQSGGVVLRIGI